MKYNIDNIIKLFVTDTYICSTSNLDLRSYQQNKHGWNYETWNEYFQIYRTNINNVGFIESLIK